MLPFIHPEWVLWLRNTDLTWDNGKQRTLGQPARYIERPAQHLYPARADTKARAGAAAECIVETTSKRVQWLTSTEDDRYELFRQASRLLVW